ncbi:hypothetical protein TNCV_333961 [Trichonephila clavipes]|nr:hypothetical protein TNCV_333961 [Trichonephila clavipes]
MVKRRGRHLSSNPSLLTTTPHQREDVSALDIFNLHRCPTQSEIELVIPFVPNRDPPDTPQQSELGEVVHYHPSE